MRTLALLLALVPLAAGEPETPRRAAARKAEEAQSLRNRLETRRVSFRFENTPVTDFLRFLSQASGVNIVVKTGVLEKEGIDLEAVTVDLELEGVRVRDALELALEPLKLGLLIEGNVLLVTTKKDARGKPVLAVYTIADLMFPLRDFPAPDLNLYPSKYQEPEVEEPDVQRTFESSDEIAELVRQFTGRETWEDEGIHITVFRHHLFVRQYPEVHREIARFLAALRGLR